MIVVKDAPELRGDGGTRRHPFECLAFVCDSRQTARRLTFALANAFQVLFSSKNLTTQPWPVSPQDSMSFFASCSFANLSFWSCSHLPCRSSPRRSSRHRRRSRPSLRSTYALPRRSSKTSRTSSILSAERLFFKDDCNRSKMCKIIIEIKKKASMHKRLK